MKTTQDRIWFKKTRHSIEGRLEFSKEIQCLDANAIPFQQELQIREQIKDDIYRGMFGQLPSTCLTVIRHLATVEADLRERGEKHMAAKLAASIALVGAMHSQMVISRPDEAARPDNYGQL